MIPRPSVAWLRSHSTRELRRTDEQRMQALWSGGAYGVQLREDPEPERPADPADRLDESKAHRDTYTPGDERA